MRCGPCDGCAMRRVPGCVRAPGGRRVSGGRTVSLQHAQLRGVGWGPVWGAVERHLGRFRTIRSIEFSYACLEFLPQRRVK